MSQGASANAWIRCLVKGLWLALGLAGLYLALSASILMIASIRDGAGGGLFPLFLLTVIVGAWIACGACRAVRRLTADSVRTIWALAVMLAWYLFWALLPAVDGEPAASRNGGWFLASAAAALLAYALSSRGLVRRLVPAQASGCPAGEAGRRGAVIRAVLRGLRGLVSKLIITMFLLAGTLEFFLAPKLHPPPPPHDPGEKGQAAGEAEPGRESDDAGGAGPAREPAGS